MSKGLNRKWLDRLAYRAAGGLSTPVREAEAPSGLDERLSRAAVLRLSLAAVGGLSLGLWRPSGSRADGIIPHTCLDDCVDTFEDAWKADYARCDRLSDSLVGPWSRWKRNITPTAWEWATLMTNEALVAACVLRSQNAHAWDVEKCGRQQERKTTPGCAPPLPKTPVQSSVPPAAPKAGGLGCDPFSCTGVCCDCGYASGPICATYVGTGLEPCDICVRNCVGSC